jgi:cell division septal protein FtsQ
MATPELLQPIPTSEPRQRKRARRKGYGEGLAALIEPSPRERQIKRWSHAILALKLVACAAAVGAMATYALKTWREHAHSQRDYRLSNINIVGGLHREFGGLTVDDVKAVAGVDYSTNLSELDVEKVQSQLAALPGMMQVEVESVLPNELRIRPTERLPLAWLVCAAEGLGKDTAKRLLLSADGHLLPCPRITQTLSELPEIRVPSCQLPEGKVPVPERRIRETLQLLEAFHETDWPYALRVVAFDLKGDFLTELQLSDGAKVTLGLGAAPGEIAKLASIYHYADEKHPDERVETVRLQQDTNIAVTYRETVQGDAVRGSRRPVRNANVQNSASRTQKAGVLSPAASPRQLGSAQTTGGKRGAPTPAHSTSEQRMAAVNAHQNPT